MARADQVCDSRRVCANTEFSRALLNRLVGNSHSFVLSQMLDPRLDEKRLDKAFRIFCSGKEIPPECAVPKAYATQVVQNFAEFLFMKGVNLVFDHNEDRTAVKLQIRNCRGVRPVSRRLEIL